MEESERESSTDTLRMRAEAWLNGNIPMPDVRVWETGIEALAILYKMANLPASSDDALKLLHELQVHQIELALQREELEKAYSDLLAASQSERERYEFAPVGYVTVSRDLEITDINRTAAGWFDSDVSALIGHSFATLLTADSRPPLRALIDGLPGIGSKADSPIQVISQCGDGRRLQLKAKIAPTRHEYCIAVIDETDWISSHSQA